MSSINIIATKYARALFEVGLESNKPESISAELQACRDIIYRDSIYSKHILSTSLPTSYKLGLFQKKFISEELSDIIKNTIKVLINNNRLYCIDEILSRYLELLRQHYNILSVNVVSAIELPKKMQIKIKELMKDKLTYKDIQLNCTQDKSLLGGLIIKYRSKRLDLSISSQLNALQKSLT